MSNTTVPNANVFNLLMLFLISMIGREILSIGAVPKCEENYILCNKLPFFTSQL